MDSNKLDDLEVLVRRLAPSIRRGDRMRYPKGSRFNGYEMTEVTSLKIAAGALVYDEELRKWLVDGITESIEEEESRIVKPEDSPGIVVPGGG